MATGPKPKLSYLEKIYIGAEFEKEWSDAARRLAAENLAAIPTQKRLNAFEKPLWNAEKRTTWPAQEYKNLREEYYKARANYTSKRSQIIGKRKLYYKSIIGPFKHTRPYIMRLHIIAKLAKRHQISERMVETCIKTYRKFLCA